MQINTTPGSGPSAATEAPAQRGPSPETNGTAAEQARHQATQRAEELVDWLGEQIGRYASSFGNRVLRWFSRVREEAEDIWAEAHALRDSQRAANDQSNSAPSR
jgi:hypothetical protein